jgi:hypothetical protein
MLHEKRVAYEIREGAFSHLLLNLKTLKILFKLIFSCCIPHNILKALQPKS